MKKFASHQQRKYSHQILFYLFLLILIIIFIATIGIKLIINTTLFVAEYSHRDRDKLIQKTSNTEFILPPEILDLPSATNSATIHVTGKATRAKKLSLYVNDKLYKEIVLPEDSFETDIDLDPGENSIYLALEDSKTKQKKQSVTYQVVYKSEKPKLEIIFPNDQEKVSKDEIEVVGQTDKETFIKINELPAIVNVEGKFLYTLKLKEGENMIKIEAQDIAGNIETKELTVIYQKEE